MSDEPLNPVDIENAIRDCSNRIANSVRVVTEREAEAKRCRRAYDLANARAVLAANASNADGRKAQATIATEVERAAAEDAEIAYEFAKRTVRALEKELDALRSVGTSVRSMYQVAGRGES